MSASPSPAAIRPRPEQIRLHCMEIWGGNEAYDNAISMPGIDAYIRCLPQPGNRSGGDIHYVSMCGSGRITRFAVADVSGHGDSVGEVATGLRRLMKRYINNLNQASFARALNEAFTRASEDGTFATAILATYFAPDDHLILVNAGHPAPLWYRAALKTWQMVCPDMPDCADRLSNLPLGVIAPTQYRQFAIKLAKDDLVLLYTDSFPEARSPAGELLGEDGLLDVVRWLNPADPQQFRDALIHAIADYRGQAPAEDDMTLLVLHHNAANPPWPGVGETIRNIGKLLGLVRF